MTQNESIEAAAPHAPYAGRGANREVRLLQAVVAVLVAIKLIFILFAGPSSDEAYYWLWGRHPALSYFDHPPLHSWLQGLSYTVFGRSLFALRWMTIATMLGTFVLFRFWARRIAPEGWEVLLWRSMAAYLATAIFLLFFSVAFHDYLLAFLALLSAHFFLLFLSAVAAGDRGQLRYLYFGALVLGLAALTKYAAVFIGLGLVVTILSNRSLRPLLRTPHLYLAAGLSLIMQAPVAIWNMTEGFASFRFHFVGRHASDWLANPGYDRLLEFPLASVLLLSPFLVPAFVRFFMAQPETPFERVGQRWAMATFAITSGAFLLYSLYDYVNFWWNVPAYLLAMPFLGKYLGRRWLIGHVLFGGAMNLLILFNYVVVPIPTLFGNNDFRLTQLYGWELLEPAIEPLVVRYQPDFIASDNAETANITAFALDDPDVTSLSPLTNQFDYWFDPEAHRGETALLVMEATDATEFLRSQFESFEEVASVPVTRFGLPVRSFVFYLGRGYTPETEPP